MTKLNVNLIALDLDDTLLNNNREISDQNVAALQKCVEKGIYVVLCSGRAEDGILPFVRRLDIAGKTAGKYLIALNGCSIYDMHERKQIYSNFVDPEILLYAHREAKKMGLDTEVYKDSVIYYSKETPWTLKDVELCNLKGALVEDYENFIKNGSPKMLIPGDPEDIQVLQKKLKDDLGEKAEIFTSKPFFLEIMPPNAGKGEAIIWLAKHAGIDPKNTLCFGDSMNDENMIRRCGYSVAMCNGLDYIKKLATFTSEKSNDESGVADFIEKYVL